MCFPAKLRDPFGTQNTSHPRCFGCQATCSLTFSMNSPVHQSRSWRPPSAGKPQTVDTFLTVDSAHTTQRGCPLRRTCGLSDCLRPTRAGSHCLRPIPGTLTASVCMGYQLPTVVAMGVTPPFTRSPALICHARSSVLYCSAEVVRGGDICDLRSYHRDGHARTAFHFSPP